MSRYDGENHMVIGDYYPTEYPEMPDTREQEPVTPRTALERRATDYFNALDKILTECSGEESAFAERVKKLAYDGLKRAWS